MLLGSVSVGVSVRVSASVSVSRNTWRGFPGGLGRCFRWWSLLYKYYHSSRRMQSSFRAKKTNCIIVIKESGLNNCIWSKSTHNAEQGVRWFMPNLIVVMLFPIRASEEGNMKKVLHALTYLEIDKYFFVALRSFSSPPLVLHRQLSACPPSFYEPLATHNNKPWNCARLSRRSGRSNCRLSGQESRRITTT